MLEDLYSDNLVDEPDDIEHVIEGEEFEKKDVSDRESGNEEEKNVDEKDKEKETEKIKRKQGPRIVLNAQRLTGPRGIGVMESFFSDVPEKLRGKGREREDLELVMGRLEHWAHRMMPRLQFDDCLKKIETLGNKKIVINMVKRIRLGMEDEVVPEEVLRREEMDSPPPDVDPFDELISSSAPTRPAEMEITAEQREQMLRNRLIAEERRAARIKRAQEMKERFQSQRTANSQPDSSQATGMEIASGRSPEAGRESHQDSVEHESCQLDEAGPISVDENPTNVGLENDDEEYQIQSDILPNKDDVEVEMPNENGTPIDQCEIPAEDMKDQPEVPEEMCNNPEEGNESCAVEPGRSEDQPNVSEERNGIQPDILADRDGNEGVLIGNQPDILAQRIDIQPDILSVGRHENNELSERNESRPDVLSGRSGSRPDVVSRNFNEPLIQEEREENILVNRPEVIEIIAEQPVVLEVNDNQQPDILPDRIENQPDILMERIGNQPDVVMERSIDQPDILN